MFKASLIDIPYLASEEPGSSTGDSLGKMQQADQQDIQRALMHPLIAIVLQQAVQYLVLSLVLSMSTRQCCATPFAQPIAPLRSSCRAIQKAPQGKETAGCSTSRSTCDARGGSMPIDLPHRLIVDAPVAQACAIAQGSPMGTAMVHQANVPPSRSTGGSMGISLGGSMPIDLPHEWIVGPHLHSHVRSHTAPQWALQWVRQCNVTPCDSMRITSRIKGH